MLDYTSTSIIERELLLAKVSILGPEFAQEQLLGPTPYETFDQAVLDQNPRDGVQPLTSTEGEQTSTQNTDKSAREQAMARSFEAAGGDSKSASGGQGGSSSPLYPNRQPGMTASEALIAKNLHLSAIKTLAEGFNGKVVDVAENIFIVELTAKSSRVEAFLSLIKPFGILEAARSGTSILSIVGECERENRRSARGKADCTGVMVLPRTPVARYTEDEEISQAREEIDVSMLPPG